MKMAIPKKVANLKGFEVNKDLMLSEVFVKGSGNKNQHKPTDCTDEIPEWSEVAFAHVLAEKRVGGHCRCGENGEHMARRFERPPWSRSW